MSGLSRLNHSKGCFAALFRVLDSYFHTSIDFLNENFWLILLMKSLGCPLHAGRKRSFFVLIEKSDSVSPILSIRK